MTTATAPQIIAVTINGQQHRPPVQAPQRRYTHAVAARRSPVARDAGQWLVESWAISRKVAEKQADLLKALPFYDEVRILEIGTEITL